MKAKKLSVNLFAALKDANKKGEVQLYLLVIINRKRRQIPLKIYWPVEYYDFTNHQLLKRGSRDKQFSDFSMIIQREISKCNDIFVSFRLRDAPLTMEIFLEEFHQYHLKRDFILYMENKINDRYKRKQIEFQTKKNHTNTLKKLKDFQPKELPFESVNVKWCRDFETYLKKKLGLSVNTVWTHMKDINSYLNFAKDEDQIPIKNPFQNGYSISSKDSDVSALSLDELKILMQYHRSVTIPDNHYQVLTQFLFSCFTGLRISDLKAIKSENIVGDELIFFPKKTQRFEKLQRIPLTEKAKQFIQTTVEGKLFPEWTPQASNRILKKIQDKCGIKTKLTNHVARHSFATIYLEIGGSVEVLQPLLGHYKISTTMKYVHIKEKRKKDQMDNFDKLDF